jgi:hypothetical protein
VKRHADRHNSIPLWLFGLVLFITACKLLGTSGDLQSTASVVYAQQTSLARTVTALAGQAVLEATSNPPASFSTQPATPTQLLSTGSIATVNPVLTQSPPTLEEQRLLKSAKILLFEDMSASRYIRLVKEALDEAGYFYLDVGSAKGWFKSQLLSGVDWDLVIAAAEAEREFGGEFFEYIDAHLERGAAVIIENWDLDNAPLGRVKPILDRCGVSFQSDWYEPEMRVFYWTDPADPILNYPNQLSSGLRNTPRLWHGDIGDLLEVKPRTQSSMGMQSGEAVILASDNHSSLNDHGLLVSCVGGRMILQTFRSHEYHHDDMVALWQNYIYQTLMHHFAYTKTSLPTPAATYMPVLATVTPLSTGPTPGPDYTFPHGCGPALSARLVEAPDYRRDLFEHHATGTFLILRLELVNQTTFPIQMWDHDYSVEGEINSKPVAYAPHAAATGYLYIERPSNLYQDLIQPGKTWRTSVAFDVPPEGRHWRLVLRPGSEFNQQVCEVSIPLDR